MSTPEDFPQTVEQARTDIELTREELGDTAQALAHKLNVPQRTKEQVRMRSSVAVSRLRENAVPLAVVGALAALVVGGVLTWRMKR
ncbi:Protein of unknown function (DUF3618) [Saccharomonospora marina XMU15]|uniref:DUF3618 domain-containing protein n=1 Tax=Saccharomonospora marina XMU15 TaxID=882083 RepID=H5X2F9_9PSEU|nr:DUF3618 domain-containing protein [Saccharomonospora marina]EHR49824.1 Protein of unknown function (DUF3618) [Saccharomonospora marina XMU15]